jgi:hypothetical protein
MSPVRFHTPPVRSIGVGGEATCGGPTAGRAASTNNVEQHVLDKKWILAAAVVAMGATPFAVSALDGKLEVVAEGLKHPMVMVSPPGDDRKFIFEQTRAIKILGADGKLLDGDFPNIRHKLPPLKWEFDEEGLLGVAFPPDFKKTGKFYISYTGNLRGDADIGKQL